MSNVHSRCFPGGPVVKDSTVPMQGAWVKSLVGELRFCMLYSTAKKKKKKKSFIIMRNLNNEFSRITKITILKRKDERANNLNFYLS